MEITGDINFVSEQEKIIKKTSLIIVNTVPNHSLVLTIIEII
jgi:hypothetical protein